MRGNNTTTREGETMASYDTENCGTVSIPEYDTEHERRVSEALAGIALGHATILWGRTIWRIGRHIWEVEGLGAHSLEDAARAIAES